MKFYANDKEDENDNDNDDDGGKVSIIDRIQSGRVRWKIIV